MRTVIVYHTDIDGYLSGAILQQYLEENGYKPDMVRMNYGDQFPWNLVDSETEVWMADFGLQPWADMARLQKECKKLIWIDHHKSAIQSYDEWVEAYGQPLEGLRQDGKAACRLCWEYCYPGKEEPLPVYLAGKYDVWEWKDVEGALEFQYGTKFYETDPGTPEGKRFWFDMFITPKVRAKETIAQGTLLMSYLDRSNANSMRRSAFETVIDNLHVIAANKGGNSRIFDSVWDPEKYDAMLTFVWGNGMWTCSLYSDREDVDVSVVAKNHGGGGHKGAAGFQCMELPFDLR